MTIAENIGEFWTDMSGWQKAVVIAVAAIAVTTVVVLAVSWIGTSMEIRRLEREATHAKREAEKYLETAAKIAREKLEIERRLAELEMKRDGKQTEAEKAAITTIDARREHNRALRESRSDEPTAGQLCAELEALGYACQ